MKKNIDYYPHKTEAHRHPKFKMLRSLYDNISDGWAAEGRFWALNNLIAGSENCVLDLQKKRNKGVFADELGLSISEFDDFLKILASEDVELLTAIDEDIYTTETVQVTYSSISQDRENALNRYKKSKKSEQNNISDEKLNTSGEVSNTSGEARYKVNKSEVKGIELNKIKEKEIKVEEITSSVFFNKCKELFKTHTKISDPNIKSHVGPIIQIYEQIPEDLTQMDVEECIENTFKTLDKNKGVKISFLTDNILKKITAKHEEVLSIAKEKDLKNAKIYRIKAEKEENELLKKENSERLTLYKNFFETNPQLFSQKEKYDLVKYLQNKQLTMAGMIIESKMEEVELG